MRLAQRPRVAADYPFLHRWDPARYSPSYLRQSPTCGRAGARWCR